MNQNAQSGHGWIVGDFIGWLIMGIVIFFSVIYLRYPNDLISSVLFWAGYSFMFIVVVVWEIKRPSKKEWQRWVKSFVVSLVLGFLFWFFIFGYVHDAVYGLNNPNFKILDTSDTFNSQTGNYAFHAQIRNDGADGYMTVYCEVRKADLTTTAKSQRIYLRRNQETTLHFYFQIYGDLGGQLAQEYKFSLKD